MTRVFPAPSDMCPSRNAETGERCHLDAGHPGPHQALIIWDHHDE